jgi:rhodanese-related sulfurtransferase
MVDIKRVSAREARALMDAGYAYVDVRSEQEFDLGHPSGAVNVPFQLLGPSGMGQNP